ncbi:MAG: hypothetical protein AAGN82_02190 [Myxococcota bacterium]
MPDVTFRDFAGALMAQDDAKAGSVLETLMGVDAATAAAGVSFFQAEMKKSPDFMMKSMEMRGAVEQRDEAKLTELIAACFGYGPEAAAEAATTLLAHYA